MRDGIGEKAWQRRSENSDSGKWRETRENVSGDAESEEKAWRAVARRRSEEGMSGVEKESAVGAVERRRREF